jgi:hypothetical protein
VFSRIYNWVTDRNSGIKILASRMDQEMDGFATGLSNTICRDGQSTITQDIPFNNRKITGLANATADADALNRITADGRFLSSADGSVTTAKIADDAVTTAKLDDDAVTTAKIDDGAVTFAKIAPQDFVDVASATTTDVGAAASQNVRITGTTTITGLGTVAAGTFRRIRFADALTLTHDATSLILPSGANIVTAANDTAEAVSLGSGNWLVTDYQRASGEALVSTASGLTLGTSVATTSGTAFDFTGIPAGVKRIQIVLDLVSLSGADHFLIQIGDSGGLETTGYVSGAQALSGGAASAAVTSTTGFIAWGGAAAAQISGIVTLVNPTGNVWVESHATDVQPSSGGFGGGSKTLSDELTQLRLTRTGSDTFDAGAVNIIWEI